MPQKRPFQAYVSDVDSMGNEQLQDNHLRAKTKTEREKHDIAEGKADNALIRPIIRTKDNAQVISCAGLQQELETTLQHERPANDPHVNLKNSMQQMNSAIRVLLDHYRTKVMDLEGMLERAKMDHDTEVTELKAVISSLREKVD